MSIWTILYQGLGYVKPLSCCLPVVFLWVSLLSFLSPSLLEYSISSGRHHCFPRNQASNTLSMFYSNHAPDMT